MIIQEEQSATQKLRLKLRRSKTLVRKRPSMNQRPAVQGGPGLHGHVIREALEVLREGRVRLEERGAHRLPCHAERTGAPVRSNRELTFG